MQQQEVRNISTINVILPPHVKSEIQVIAAAYGLSLSALVRLLVYRIAARDPVVLAWFNMKVSKKINAGQSASGQKRACVNTTSTPTRHLNKP